LDNNKRIDGKAIATRLRKEIKEDAEAFRNKFGRQASLAVVLVGDDPASSIYVRMKGKACEEANIRSLQYNLPGKTSQDELLDLIGNLNEDGSIDGILVQLPLPDHIDEDLIIESVSPEKDVGGFHPENVGKLVIGQDTFYPCTPFGIIRMLDVEGVELKGKRAVVLGRSNIVGKPLAFLFLHRHATVTMCHSRTVDLPSVTREADILVAAVGRPRMVGKEMVKEGAIIIDVGVNRLPDGKVVGDVDYDDVVEKVSKITPVPGGVGPMTITMLLYNTIKAANLHES